MIPAHIDNSHAGAIAIVGMACRYPDANSPGELWENVLAQRQAFRRIPDERLRLADYYSSDRTDGDRIYTTQAALLKDYTFDRMAFRVAGATYRQADLTHWLALDVASQALVDAGYAEGEGLPRTTTGVILGNTLTGEFSRANLMRGRWPYVRRVVEAALIEQGWQAQQRGAFLANLETTYKAPFPPIGEETLAGGLSNTIAGRICNHFDLKGGGYTVDGACASSLLAITTACTALTNGDIDVALAGGVDLSLDPFELVGFARTSALAPEKMRVFDRRSAGFWPGEGCGLVVLLRYVDAIALGKRIYAVIRGWGVSSDGNGGITRPEVDGQVLAVQRAYQRAGFGADSVAYFEGHGTGTAVGDATELRTISQARRAAMPNAECRMGSAACVKLVPAVIGSVKGNIGHTKAAAGVAGLIKSTLALYHQVLPPNSGNEDPHPELTGERPMLRVLKSGMLWPQAQPLRAGVSAMGFGGINSHLALESGTTRRRKRLDAREAQLLSSSQDAELFLFGGRTSADLQQQIAGLLAYAGRLALAELTDLAVELAHQLRPAHWRAALVASTSSELADRLHLLQDWLAAGITERQEVRNAVFLSNRTQKPRIGYLFPGQGTRVYLEGQAWARRFPLVAELYEMADLEQFGYQGVETAVAQPAVITAALAGLALLDQLGIEAAVAVGHSLGELAALHWAGAFDEAALLRIAAVRGKAMMALGAGTGTMATIGAGPTVVQTLVNGEVVNIACFNSPQQTVIAGEAVPVARVVARAQTQGIAAHSIPVSHAFHSPLVAAASSPLAAHLRTEHLQPLRQPVISTVTGEPLAADTDLIDLLQRQVTAPVCFTDAVRRADPAVDLWIEVGPGHTLTALSQEFVDTPVIALDAGGASLKGLLTATGAAYVLGTNPHVTSLFTDRFSRPFDLHWQATFLVNPCELAPLPESRAGDGETGRQGDKEREEVQRVAPTQINEVDEVENMPTGVEGGGADDILMVVRQLIAAKVELPLDAIGETDRLLSDLHLNSITVTQIVASAARQLGIAAPVAPTEFANLSVADVAQSLSELAQHGATQEQELLPAGVAAWVRTFVVDWVERPLPTVRKANSAVKASDGWRLFAPATHPLTPQLQPALAALGTTGVVVCLPPAADESTVDLLLAAAQQVLRQNQPTHFVMVQHGGGAASLARTLHLEAPPIPVTVVDVPIDHAEAVHWILSEIQANQAGYHEVRYDAAGRRLEPVLRLFEKDRETRRQEDKETLALRQGEEGRYEIGLDADDVLLVTGGGKGITAECALSLAAAIGVKLALFGRSQPQADSELLANLERMRAAGVQFQYCAVDVTDAAAVQAAIQQVERDLGKITAILHGAARNAPKRLADLTAADIHRTLAPKLQGIRNVLAAINPAQLRLLVGFGSIIGQLGLPGEADYGLANEWMAHHIAQLQQAQARCRCLTIDWSVWAGAGMGEKLGVLDSLVRQGIMPIPLESGVQMLLHLLNQPNLPSQVIVAGRYGEPTTLRPEQSILPFRRFLEQVRVHVPGVELVVDATLSGENDPYLDDHIFRGDRLFLAVLGLEAMAQAAMALTGATKPPIFAPVQFHRPIVVPPGSEVTIRLAALHHENGDVAVVLRSAETGFQADHFQAICRFAEPNLPRDKRKTALDAFPLLQLDPGQELYEQLFFHKGRFRRVQGYRQVTAQGMVAVLTANDEQPWFGRYLPQDLILGDPGARDATIHAIQVCVPLGTLLPMSVERIEIVTVIQTGPRFVHAVERQSAATAETLTFDVTVVDEAGNRVERWQGLKLKRMDGTAYAGAWSPPVLAPYLERRMRELLTHAPSVALVRERVENQAERRKRSSDAMQRAIGKPLPIHHRADGKPSTRGKWEVSAAHAGDLTLAVAAPKETGALGCDLEAVQTRSRATWQDLLGAARLPLADLVAIERGDPFDVAATRVWGAIESLRKAGVALDTPLTLATTTPDRWVIFAAGVHHVATYVAQVQGIDEPVVATVTVGGRLVP